MARSKPPLCGFSCAEISGKEAFAPMNDTFMKTKPVFPLLVSMALPNVISMLVNSLYNIVDSLFVAQINEQAMTALSLVFPIQNFVSAVAIGFGIGINALVALYRGAGDHDRADAAGRHRDAGRKGQYGKSLSDRPAIGYHETDGLSREKYDFSQKAFQGERYHTRVL